MRQPGENYQDYMNRRVAEANSLGITKTQGYMEMILSTDHELPLIVELSQLPDFTIVSAFDALDHGHTSYEMKNYGPLAVRYYTAQELSASTVTPLTLKRMLSLFSYKSFSRSDKPDLKIFETLESFNIKSASKYLKVARFLNLDGTSYSNIFPVLKALRNSQELQKILDN